MDNIQTTYRLLEDERKKVQILKEQLELTCSRSRSQVDQIRRLRSELEALKKEG